MHDEAEESAVPVDEGVTHWLLIPPDAVEEARRQLATLGFDDITVLDEQRNGLVDVLVSQQGDLAALRSSAEETERRLTALARNFGGQYDGTEWALPR